MFLCEDCYNKMTKRMGFYCLHMFRDYGPCEECGKTKMTADCTHYKEAV